jgi:hypothetical protein
MGRRRVTEQSITPPLCKGRDVLFIGETSRIQTLISIGLEEETFLPFFFGKIF